MMTLLMMDVVVMPVAVVTMTISISTLDWKDPHSVFE